MKGMPITRGGRADFLLQHTSACVLHIDMHACALIKSFVHSFARLLETTADYPARLKDLALSRRAARAVATEATSHASPAGQASHGWSTTENMAFICTSSAVTQQDADAAYYDVVALSSWALKATERNPRSTSMSLCIAAEETLVPSYVIEQLELQLMPAIITATFLVQCRPQLTFQRNLAIYGYEIATIQDASCICFQAFDKILVCTAAGWSEILKQPDVFCPTQWTVGTM